MNIEEFREFCLTLPGVSEGFPFNETTLVFKVQGKMFALTSLERAFAVNLKCKPEKAIELREQFPSVTPGYHMNRKHWNTVLVDGTIADEKIREWTKDSYELVVAGLPKKIRDNLTK